MGAPFANRFFKSIITQKIRISNYKQLELLIASTNLLN